MEVIVVMDEVIVVVVVPITVPVVAMPYRSTVPATTTPSTNIGKMSTIYSADVTFTNMSDTASTDVADTASTDVADTAPAEMDAAHATSEASTASGIGTIESDWDKEQAARKGSYCSDTGFHD